MWIFISEKFTGWKEVEFQIVTSIKNVVIHTSIYFGVIMPKLMNNFLSLEV